VEEEIHSVLHANFSDKPWFALIFFLCVYRTFGMGVYELKGITVVPLTMLK